MAKVYRCIRGASSLSKVVGGHVGGRIMSVRLVVRFLQGFARTMTDLLRALSQVGALKDLRRAGWARKGLTGTESVADHTFRTAVLALVLSADLGVDTGRLLKLVLIHDLAESDPSVGDITPYCGVEPGEKRRREREAMVKLCASLPGGDDLLGLWLEYDEGRTPEAEVAHQLDALEMAIQAREYAVKHGVNLSEFERSARAKVRHPALLRLLDDAWSDG